MQSPRPLALLVAFVLLTVSFFSSAQSTSAASSVMYVEIGQLNTDTYVTLFNHLKESPSFELIESCVPAHVVTIKIRSGSEVSEALFNVLKNDLSSIGLSGVKWLSTFDDQQFMNRCLNARRGQ